MTHRNIPGWLEGEHLHDMERDSEDGGLSGRGDARFWEYFLALDSGPLDRPAREKTPPSDFVREGTEAALPVMLSLRRWLVFPTQATRDDCLRAVRGLAAGVFLEKRPGCVLTWRRDTLVLLLYGPQLPSGETLRALCLRLGEEVERVYHCELACYIGEPGDALWAAAQVDLLRKGDMDNVTDTRAIRTLAQVREKREQLTLPVLRDWMPYFIDGQTEEFCRCIEDYFAQTVAANGMDRAFLARFQQDFIQEVAFALKNAGIPLHRLFSGTDELLRMENAIRNLSDMAAWVRLYAARAIDLMRPKEEGATISERVCDYIGHRLVYPFRREELARALHLSEGHIARVFRAEMGMTIQEYLIGERIELACRNIRQTRLPLAQIAEQCGFRDYPYFYKTFRRHVGMSPTEYQRKMQDSDQ